MLILLTELSAYIIFCKYESQIRIKFLSRNMEFKILIFKPTSVFYFLITDNVILRTMLSLLKYPYEK